jgi:SAM-dependent methyltransferase
MCGVQRGERVLQVGVDDPTTLGLIAAKAGMSGTAACVVADEAAGRRARSGADKVGVLVEVAVAAPTAPLPHADAAFDVVVVHSVSGLLAGLGSTDRQALLGECGRVLRPGGRVVAIERGTREGLASLLKSTPAAQGAFDAEGGCVRALQAAGFSPVRALGDREGLRFSEGFKTT